MGVLRVDFPGANQIPANLSLIADNVDAVSLEEVGGMDYSTGACADARGILSNTLVGLQQNLVDLVEVFGQVLTGLADADELVGADFAAVCPMGE